MSHCYHDNLPGYHPDQLLHKGCAECDDRAKDPGLAIVNLDQQNFHRAWRRTFDLHASAGDLAAVDQTINPAEEPMLDALWAVQLQLERAGHTLDGYVPVPRPSGREPA